MVAYLFAGQGSQYVGMGKDLYEAFPASKRIFDKADQVLGFSLSRLCFEGPKEELARTNNSQPAILTMSIAALEAYRSVSGVKPSDVGFTAGLSLGEYSALVASGAMSFEDTVYLVMRRGEFMEEEALKKPGKMLSLIGLDLAAVKQICLQARAEIANINCPGQTVISGGIKEIEAAQTLAKAAQAKMVVQLEVSGAFHSSFMQGASLKLEKELSKINISSPRIPVVSNVTARVVVSPQEIKDNLVKQVASSVLWEDSMKFLLAQGVTNFLEFGPGKVLRGLMRRINPEAQVANIEKKGDICDLKTK
ncbi:MAG: ACP S-malonyltransferase [Candidatus Omnitrophica bacterium]|nr:ACP S-malonyltransferase [Candidatus Omnitrophota bacterium]